MLITNSARRVIILILTALKKPYAKTHSFTVATSKALASANSIYKIVAGSHCRIGGAGRGRNGG